MTAVIQNTSALAVLKTIFRRYGLPATLNDWAWSQLQAGKSDEEILLALYGRAEFKARFPAIDERAKAGLAAITPEDYLNYEQGVSEHLARAGMPRFMWAKGKYFNDLVTRGLTNDVSLDEAIERVDQGLAKVAAAPMLVRGAFNELFGIQGEAALASLYLDPDRSVAELQRMYNQADVMGTGRRYGIDIAREQSARVAELDLSHATVEQGLADVNAQRGLYDERLGEQTDLTASDTGVSAAFGLDPEAKRQLERRAQERRASTAGAAAAVGDRGVGGLGRADQ